MSEEWREWEAARLQYAEAVYKHDVMHPEVVPYREELEICTLALMVKAIQTAGNYDPGSEVPLRIVRGLTGER